MSFIPCPNVREPENPQYKSQSKSKGLRTKSVDVQRQEKRDVPPYTMANSSFFHIFVLLELSVDWMMTNCNREATLLSLLIQVLISSETPSQTHLERIFYQLSGRPSVQSS